MKERFLDEQGNAYYEKHGRRFVVYKDKEDPSLLPPRFYMWLHHYVEHLPDAVFVCPKKKNLTKK